MNHGTAEIGGSRSSLTPVPAVLFAEDGFSGEIIDFGTFDHTLIGVEDTGMFPVDVMGGIETLEATSATSQ